MHKLMTTVIIGVHTGLDRIEVPTEKWFYLAQEQESYHYNNGVFEVHSKLEGYDIFFISITI